MLIYKYTGKAVQLFLLSQLAELFIYVGQNAVCLCIWMLSKVAQTVATAHRLVILHAHGRRPTNKP